MRAGLVLAGCAALSACSQQGGPAGENAQAATMIPCALGGASSLTEACAVERVAAGDEVQLIVRHPDGGFRRFTLSDDGASLSSADGAEPARVQTSNTTFDIAVEQDRYRIPANIVKRDHER